MGVQLCWGLFFISNKILKYSLLLAVIPRNLHDPNLLPSCFIIFTIWKREGRQTYTMRFTIEYYNIYHHILIFTIWERDEEKNRLKSKDSLNQVNFVGVGLVIRSPELFTIIYYNIYNMREREGRQTYIMWFMIVYYNTYKRERERERESQQIWS